MAFVERDELLESSERAIVALEIGEGGQVVPVDLEHVLERVGRPRIVQELLVVHAGDTFPERHLLTRGGGDGELLLQVLEQIREAPRLRVKSVQSVKRVGV